MILLNAFAFIGRMTLGFFAQVGSMTRFAGRALASIITPRYYPGQLWQQFVEMFFFSLPVIGLTGLFTGMVLALQGEAALSRLSAESAIPQIVAISILRELGPVVAGLMLAGRVGSSIAAELSTMRVNEQVDALTTMSIDPWHYLIAPRVLAALIALPVLVVVANVIGIGGGYLIAVFQLDFDGTRFLTTILGFIQPQDWALSLTKALIFGAIVGLFGCYMGFNARGGAQGVGLATTNAVVASSIALLLADLVITLAFFRLVG